MKKILIIITLMLFILLPGCYSSDKILANKMIEKYSNNQSYVNLSGEVIEFYENNVIIKCEELNFYINYEDDMCEYYIYSEQILDLCTGDKIDFVTVPFHFYNGHRLPIVEVIKDDNILLTFEEGKDNLLEWVDSTFLNG